MHTTPFHLHDSLEMSGFQCEPRMESEERGRFSVLCTVVEGGYVYVHAVGDLPAHLGLMVAGRAPLVTMLLVGVATHVLARNTEISVLPSQFCSTHKTALKQ